MEINLQHTKLELIQWLSMLTDSEVIQKIVALRNEETQDWWHKISEEEKNSIESGIKDANNKKLNSHSKAKKIYEKWL